MPDFIDASFLKANTHSTWDIALTCDKYGEMQKKRVKESKKFITKALQTLQRRKIPLTNLASRLINERKSKEERLNQEKDQLNMT